MQEYGEATALLRELHGDEIPPSTLHIDELIAGGRRKVRTKNWVAASVVSALLVGAIPVTLALARAPSQQQPMAIPSASPSVAGPVGPSSCSVKELETPKGYAAQVYHADSSGRHLTGQLHTTNTNGSKNVLWDNGKLRTLKLPVTYLPALVNAEGVLAGNDDNRAWVYRDGKVTTLQQPGGQFYRPVAINDKGQIVGTGRDGSDGRPSVPPIIWSADGHIEATADRPFWVRGLDEDGTVFGDEAGRFRGDVQGLLWRPGSAVASLPAPAGLSRVLALNMREGWAHGVIAAEQMTTERLQPVVWHVPSGQRVALPDDVVAVSAINRHGWVAVELRSGASALLIDGELVELPSLHAMRPRDRVVVEAISDDGRTVVGYTQHRDVKDNYVMRWTCR